MTVGRCGQSGLSLTAPFSIVGSALVLLGILSQATWPPSSIEETAKDHAGAAAALFVNHVVAGCGSALLGELLPVQRYQAMGGVMHRASPRMHFASIKLLAPAGPIFDSTNAKALDRVFPASCALPRTLQAHFRGEFDVLCNAQSAWERKIDIPLIEVQVPIRNAADQEVAVAKRNENAENFNHKLIELERHAWLVIEAALLAMNASLRVIVSRRSRLIEKQRQALTANSNELLRLLHQNSELQDRVERASRLAALESEQFLHRVGADLHDGPAQLISFALLHLDSLAPGLGATDDDGDAMAIIAAVRDALADAMGEVRSLCVGLSMPRITLLPIADALRSVIKEHERRTGTVVRSDIAILPPNTPHFVKASLCRLVQEGLNNAYHHAGGQGQSVTAWACGGAIAVEVADDGPGIAPLVSMGLQGGLGLVGLLNRIESLGGTMKILSIPSGGTRLTATMSTEAYEGSAGE